jgi:Cdc6-like AAA superfamily ATPase
MRQSDLQLQQEGDHFIQQQLIEKYKELIKEDGNKDELYKWSLVKDFAQKWEPEFDEFGKLLQEIDFKNLLDYRSETFIRHVTEYEEEARELFEMLFDETIPLNERIDRFGSEAEKLVKRNHPDQGAFQDERTIVTYLTCRFPDKYTFYKYSYYKSFVDVLGTETVSSGERYEHYLTLVSDLIENFIKEDDELIELSRSTLTEDCYVDENYNILAQDILYRTMEGEKEKEDDFFEVLKTVGLDNAKRFFNYLENITSSVGIQLNDQRVHYGVRIDQQRIHMTIGMRYCFWIGLEKSEITWGFIHPGQNIQAVESGEFSKSPEAYWHHAKNTDLIDQELDKIIKACVTELNRTNKTPYRRFTNKFFERALFDREYRNQVSQKLFNSKMSNKMSDFTWVPVHNALSRKLLEYRNRQEELVEILKEAGVRQLNDKDEDRETFPLRVIDPFSFYRFINKYGDENRLSILNHVAEELGVVQKAEDVNGLPTSNAFATRLFPYKPDRTNEVEILWDIFENVVEGTMSSEMWDKASRLENIGSANFSQALFAANPEVYLPIDQHSRPYLKEVLQINPSLENGEDYLNLLDEVRERTDKPFYQISIDAYLWHTGENGIGGTIIKDEGDIYSAPTLSKNQLNQILYGPPGTGKTYALRTVYAPHFIQKKKRKTKEEYEADVIESMSWWEVVALVLLDEGDLTVPAIKDHRFIKIKENISNTKSLHATLWNQLQAHTSPDSKNVNASNRQEPFIFEKMENSVWTIDQEACSQKAPHLLEQLDHMEQYTGEEVEKENYRFTTFHQSFTYEDFVEGIKPVLHDESDEANDGELGYRIEKGIFYQCADEACKLAGFLGLQDCLNHTGEERREKFSKAPPYALFIDEINRGNISAILGELITLIEDDKRLTRENELIVRLPYSKSRFAVPPNLYILGTLNTADRSVEALDTALRRRFSFEEIEPDPSLLTGVEVDGIDIQNLLKQINLRIEKLLDRDHRIGHSYFLPLRDDSSLKRLKLIFADRIIPLLKEYFFGDFGKIGLVLGSSFVEEVQSESAALFAEFPGYEDVAAEYDERKVFRISTDKNWDFKSIYLPKTDLE